MKCSLGVSNFLEEISSLSHPIVSISLHWSLRKTFLSLLAILWNSAFKCVYLSFSPLPFSCTAWELEQEWQRLWGNTPRPRPKEKPQQDGRRGEITFRIKPHTRQKGSEASNKPCAPHPSPGPRDPTETETELCLSVSGGGTGQQGTASGAGALGAADLGMA